MIFEEELCSEAPVVVFLIPRRGPGAGWGTLATHVARFYFRHSKWTPACAGEV
jgi:hypothetical protein